MARRWDLGASRPAKIGAPALTRSIVSGTPDTAACVVRVVRSDQQYVAGPARCAEARTALPLLALWHAMASLVGSGAHERVVQFSCDKLRREERSVENTVVGSSFPERFCRFCSKRHRFVVNLTIPKTAPGLKRLTPEYSANGLK